MTDETHGSGPATPATPATPAGSATLHTLHDAFDALERRADAATAARDHASPDADLHDLITLPRPHARSRMIAPVAVAASVVVAAGGIALWQASSDGGSSHAGGAAPTATSANSAPTTPSSSAPVTSSPPTGPVSTRTTMATSNDGRYHPPTTSAQLAALARHILGNTATITVTPDTEPTGSPQVSMRGSGPVSVPAPSTGETAISVPPSDSGDSGGSSIHGLLTAADGNRGGYLLDVWRTTPGAAQCSGDVTDCQVSRVSRGSLAVGSWHDQSVAGGMSYELTYVRDDGAEIDIVLSNEQDPKGQSTVLSSTPPLTVQQLTAFVTSDQW